MKIKIFLYSLIVIMSSAYLYSNESENSKEYQLVKLEDDSIMLEKVDKNYQDDTSDANVQTPSSSSNNIENYNDMKNAFTLYTKGNLSFLNKEYQDAIYLYSQSIDISPTANSYYNRALSYSYIAEMSDTSSSEVKALYNMAILDYSKAIELSPNDSYLYNNRAVLYIKLDMPEKARLDLYHAKRLSENDLDILNNINQFNSKYENSL